MKLYDLAMTIEHADQKARILDSKTGRECFNGTADQLLDYSGIDYRKQSEIIRCKDCAFGEIDAEGSGSVQCQNRDTPWRRYKEEFVMSPHDYCSYARAKMKGGAE